MDPRTNNNVQYLNTGNGLVSSNPNMWIQPYGFETQNGYQTTLYVSDLTSAGTTTQQQLPGQESPVAPTPSDVDVTPAPAETQTVQVTTSPEEGSQTTTTTSQPPVLTIKILH